MLKIRIRRKKNIKNSIVNVSGDRVITLSLIIMELLLLFNFSYKDQLSFLYFISLIFYIFVVFFVLKIKVLTGVGLQCVYMLFFVQSGVLMQGLYYSLKKNAVLILMAYNFLAPVVMALLNPLSKHKKNKELITIDFKVSYVRFLFFVAVASMLFFYMSVGYIPLFAADGENARVIAMAGRGKFVVIASNLFIFSLLLTENGTLRKFRLFIAAALLIGTGYRSSMLELFLLYFIVYGIGHSKKFVFRAIIVVGSLCFFYALFGVIRSGIKWNIATLYKPVLWRFFVNTSNLSAVIERFPVRRLTYGASLLQDLSVILPGAQETFMTSLKTIMDYQFSGGSLTPTIFGEGYYSWYYPGAVIWPLLVLSFVISADKYCQKHIDGRVYYIFAYSLLGFTTSSVVPVLLNTFLPTVLVYIVSIYIGKKVKRYNVGENST